MHEKNPFGDIRGNAHKSAEMMLIAWCDKLLFKDSGAPLIHNRESRLDSGNSSVRFKLSVCLYMLNAVFFEHSVHRQRHNRQNLARIGLRVNARKIKIHRFKFLNPRKMCRKPYGKNLPLAFRYGLLREGSPRNKP